MAHRFSGLRRSMIRSGRKTFWLGGSIITTNLSGANSAALIASLNAAALALRPFTIVRTRGVWGFNSDQVGADENQHVAFGSIVVSDEATAVGITAVPTPVEQDASSWISFDMAFQRFEFSSGVGVNPNMIPQRYVIDSKSMRKVEEGQDLIEVIQNGAAGAGANITTYLKTLIKLH